jgi:hypothetical protein
LICNLGQLRNPLSPDDAFVMQFGVKKSPSRLIPKKSPVIGNAKRRRDGAFPKGR